MNVLQPALLHQQWFDEEGLLGQSVVTLGRGLYPAVDYFMT